MIPLARGRVLVIIALGAALLGPARAAEYPIGKHRFTVPDGFEIELVANTALVPRPICADFDQQGYLYVADSSGSNDPVQVQLERKPHRIVRLADSDGDGQFDEAITFADRLMFPEGVLWHAGSLYVAAPPSIWKLTDTDGDGVADQREEWFEGGTLTGCANDLHGPYLGRDGWIYWCKGAFAEQTYERPGKAPLVTKAAHIFRRDPRSGIVEPVMTGGMDNPVELVFTPGGERIFSTTFLQHPAGGRRDGLIHAVYGGVYGKPHAVLDGHPRTGDLLPALVHLGAAAPCGLALLESAALGSDYQHSVLACSFNMHKVTRHVLQPSGASFSTADDTLLASDNIDFHPTDVLEDADGSILVIDTGGWYKLCCPTSHLHKPDVLGGIYRVRRTGMPRVPDARGLNMPWAEYSPQQLAALLADPRPAVRQRATRQLQRFGDDDLRPGHACADILQNSPSPAARCAAVWALTQNGSQIAQAYIRKALQDRDEQVRQAALHSVSLLRDPASLGHLIELLRAESAANRRAAAEALGRLELSAAVPELLAAATTPDERMLEHSLIYALIEINDPEATRAGLRSDSVATRRAALIALDQMPNGHLEPAEVVPLLESAEPLLRETAGWLADRHPEWAESLVGHFARQLEHAEAADERDELARQLARFTGQPAFQEFLARFITDSSMSLNSRGAVIDAMGQAALEAVPACWVQPISAALVAGPRPLREAAVQAAARWQFEQIPAPLHDALLATAADDMLPADLRLAALAAARHTVALDAALFSFARQQLADTTSAPIRLAAADVLARADLNAEQLASLLPALQSLGPMELDRLLAAYASSSDEQLGLLLIEALSAASSISGVPVARLRVHLEKYGAPVQQAAARLYATLEADAEQQRAEFEERLASLAAGDVRRGQAVFYGSKAACSTCHEIGYLGGDIGPDLTQIGRIRSPRDLLESILFPSASFVRSYEPYTIVTVDGQTHNGVVRKDAADEIVLAIAADKFVTIPRDQIEEMLPGKLSVMPAGLEKQLTPQELADLIAFLQNAK